MREIESWPDRERPTERLDEYGAACLSDAELLAIILGTGPRQENVVDTARRMIAHFGGIERLSEQGLGALLRVRGIGRVKAARITAAMELGVRVVEQRLGKRLRNVFHASIDIYNAYSARLTGLRQELFLVIGLNVKNQVIRETTVAMGTIDECRVEPREVFRPLIAEAAARAILVHNHPSGDPTPSTYDVTLTRRLVRVGELVGIPILDHIIIGRLYHVSLRDLGLIMEFESAASS